MKCHTPPRALYIEMMCSVVSPFWSNENFPITVITLLEVRNLSNTAARVGMAPLLSALASAMALINVCVAAYALAAYAPSGTCTFA